MNMDTKTAMPGLTNGPQYPAGVGPLGVDLAALRDLPQGLRGRAIAALQQLEAAIALSDPDKSTAATTELVSIIAEIQAARAVADKMLGGERLQGARGAMRKFAQRAGVAV
jgi:hypothetical protein